MSDYQKPYHILLDGLERAVAQLDAVNVGAARAILIQAELDAEEAYVSAGDTGTAGNTAPSKKQAVQE